MSLFGVHVLKFENSYVKLVAFIPRAEEMSLQFDQPYFGRGGGEFAPPSWFFNTTQKLLSVGSWNFVTFSINVQHTLSNS